MRSKARATTVSTDRLPWYMPAIVLAVGIIAYANSLQGPFVFDDIDAIVSNPGIRSVSGGVHGVNTLSGRPLTRQTFVFNYSMSGLDPQNYHCTNIAIHLLAGLALLGLVRRTLLLPMWNGRFAKSATGLAVATAAIWIAHPIDTEAVTYVVQRVESLAGMFYLVTLYCFVRAAVDSDNHNRWWIFTLVACACGMASKQTMITAPVMCLLYDRTFIAGSFREAIVRRWKMYLSLAGTWVVLYGAVASMESAKDSAGFGLGVSSLDYARTQLNVIAHYFRMIFWPAGLVLDENDWPIVRHWAGVTVGGWMVAMIAIATLVALWRRPVRGFVGVWFFLILAPTSSVLPIITEVVAEHRVYLPLVGVVAYLVVGGWCLIEKCMSRTSANIRLATALTPTIAITVVLLITTIIRNSKYRTAETLWRDNVAERPFNPRAHYNLAFSLADAGDKQAALAEYGRALELEPDYANAAWKKGRMLVEMGEYQAAEKFYRDILVTIPLMAPEVHYMLGTAYGLQERWKEAEAELRKTVELDPANADAKGKLAYVIAHEGH